MLNITIDTNRPEYGGEAKWTQVSRVLRDLAAKIEQYTQDKHECPLVLLDTSGERTGQMVEVPGLLATVALADVLDTSEGTSNVAIKVERDNWALIIHPEGMGVWDGDYAPILLERHHGKVRLIVLADINEQEPTHIIDLSGALESNRRSGD